MAVEQIDIENFLQLSKECPVFDVRSPGEYLHAHMPHAFALPLFTDEQRKIIGTAYKQQSRQIAVKKGLEFFSERMKIIPVEVEEIINANKGTNNNRLLVHCWRGGMRSSAVAWLLDLYGFKVYTLKGGYKSFRKWALDQFNKEYKINILGGFTGSGKTEVLREMQRNGKNVIDLENLASHKGSAFGSLGEKPQPGQEMFENFLAIELFKISNQHKQSSNNQLWLEDESRHIGSVGLPGPLWDQMRKSPVYFLEIPFTERLQHIVSTYGKFEKKALANSIMNIQKKLGGLETKTAINFLLENNMEESFSILLHYYDRQYSNSLYKRENIDMLLNKIPCKTVDINNGKIFFSQAVPADDQTNL
jgi:tRNA 2-selenouridine synthase